MSNNKIERAGDISDTMRENAETFVLACRAFLASTERLDEKFSLAGYEVRDVAGMCRDIVGVDLTAFAEAAFERALEEL